jgi:hypothetical protein
MVENIAETENLIRVQQKALAYLRSPKENVKASLSRSKVDPTIKKLVIPNVKKLESQYGLSEELYDKYRTLEAVESQVALQFPDRKGEAYDRVISGIRELKSKVRDQMRRVLSFLTEIADKHVPKSFDQYRQAIAQEVENHVVFSDSEQFLYVSVDPDGSMVFTSYIMLSGAQATDGRKVPSLYISIQWVMGDAYYVQVNQEFELPESLSRDIQKARTMQEACRVLSMLLTDEGFESTLGTNVAPEIK